MRAMPVVLLCIALAGQPKFKPRTTYAPPPPGGMPPLSAGTEALVRVVGDEIRLQPGLEKAAVVGFKGFVMPASPREYPDLDEADRIRDAYRRAILDGDRAAIDRLSDAGDLIPLLAGKRVRVLGGWEAVTYLELPCDRRGVRHVAFIEGVLDGVKVILPARNLVPADQPPAKKRSR